MAEKFYITQLIYLRDGKEDIFDEFEKFAIPLVSRYNGSLLLRIRPDKNAFIEKTIEEPYEIHLVEFEDESYFKAFAMDEERKRFLHLKEQSVRSVILIQGKKV